MMHRFWGLLPLMLSCLMAILVIGSIWQISRIPTMIGQQTGLLRPSDLDVTTDRQSVLRVAQAYREQGDAVAAVALLEAAYQIWPDELAIQQHLVIAYRANQQTDQAEQLLDSIGLREQAAALANSYLMGGAYAQAQAWYQVLPATLELDATERFRREGLAVRGYSVLAEPLQFVQMVAPDQPLTVPGPALRWLVDVPRRANVNGTALAEHPGGDPELGVLWWTGRAAVIVEARVSGTYRVTMNLRHRAEPGAARLWLNNRVVAEFAVADQWQPFEVLIPLNEQPSLLELEYLVDNGDLFVDAIVIEATF